MQTTARPLRLTISLLHTGSRFAIASISYHYDHLTPLPQLLVINVFCIFFISAYFHSTFSFLLLPYTPVVYRPYAHAAYITLTCNLLHLVLFSFPRLVPDFSYGGELTFRKLRLTVRSLLVSSAKDPRRFSKGHPFFLSSARIGLGPCLSGLSNPWSLEG